MEALRFRRQRNFAMAVLNAAIACEVCLNDLVVAALVRDDGVEETAARDRTKRMTIRQLRERVDRAYNPSPTDEDMVLGDESDAIELIKNTFDRRNEIAHGDKDTVAIDEWAEDAIEAANRLAGARPK